MTSRMVFAATSDSCHEEVTRKGILQPCGKPAVAVRDDPEGPYPVCARHARAPMVPIATVSEALRGEV